MIAFHRLFPRFSYTRWNQFLQLCNLNDLFFLDSNNLRNDPIRIVKLKMKNSNLSSIF